MIAEDLIVAVRDANLDRIGVIPAELLDLSAAVRFNNVGAWTLRLPAVHPLAAVLRERGAGIIVSIPAQPVDGVKVWETLFSGPRTKPVTSVSAVEHGAGWLEVSGVTDEVILGDPVTYPDPANGDAETQTEATDTRTAPLETLMHEYVAANLGPAAPVARRHPKLTMGADLGRGDSVTVGRRFKNLGEVVGEFARAAGLGFRVVQQGDELVFETYQPTDRTGLVRMSVYNGGLSEYAVEEPDPACTHVLVAGQGEGADRVIRVVTTAELEAWSAATGRRLEVFLDKRQTADPAALIVEGQAYLAENGITAPAVSVKPVDATTMVLGKDWGLGDQVAVIVEAQELTSTVTEVAIVASADAKGVRVGASVGDVAGYDPQARNATRITKAEQRIAQLETSESAAGGVVAATPDTLALRDGSGRTQVATPAAAEDAANKEYVDDAVAAAGDTYHVGEPVGSVHFTMALVADAAPDGCLWLEGGTASRTTYPALFALWGTRFGAGNGTTTFGMPDMRGRVPVGYKSSGAFNLTPGTAVGAEDVTLTAAQSGVPAHTHPLTSSNGGSATVGPSVTANSNGDLAYTMPGGRANANTAANASQAHNNVQPSMVGRWYVRAATITTAPAGSTAAVPATANTVALRDAAGRTQVATPAVDADAANKGYVDQGYHLAQVLYFTSSGTFTKATYPWARAIRVRVVGGGGGGGGAAATGGGVYSTGVGGAGGGYAESFITNMAGLASSETVTVGAGGSAGAGATGGTGGTSSFGTAVVATGGAGGAVKPANVYSPYVSGPLGGVGTAGDLQIRGQGGNPGDGSDTSGSGGSGGSSQLGGGAPSVGSGSTGAVGVAGGNYGGGGGGAFNSSSQSARAGGAGAPGLVIVEVFA